MALSWEKVRERLRGNLVPGLSLFTVLLLPGVLITDAWSWPASDNLAAVCRALDPMCLQGDWFADSGVLPQPRQGIVLILTAISFFVGIESALVFVQAISTTLLTLGIILAFLNFNSQAQRTNITYFAMFVAALVPLVAASPLAAFFALGWWFPWGSLPTAATLSASLVVAVIAASGISGGTGKSSAFYSSAAIAAASFIHPVSAASAFLFSQLVRKNWNVRHLVLQSCGLLFGALLLLGSTPPQELSPETFFKIYIDQGHPFHYLPSQFSNFSDYSSLQILLLMSIGWALLSAVAWKLDREVSYRSTVALTAMNALYLGQLVFVELLEIRLFALFSPVRITEWTVTAYAFLFFSLAMRMLLRLRPQTKWAWMGARPLGPVVPGVAVIFLSLSLVTSASNLEKDWDNGALLEFKIWISETTGHSDVFVLDSSLPRTTFSIETNRPIFFGAGFPFSEGSFLEWQRRKMLFDGPTKERPSFSAEPFDFSTNSPLEGRSPEELYLLAREEGIAWFVVQEVPEGFQWCSASFSRNSLRAFSAESLSNCPSLAGFD